MEEGRRRIAVRIRSVKDLAMLHAMTEKSDTFCGAK